MPVSLQSLLEKGLLPFLFHKEAVHRWKRRLQSLAEQRSLSSRVHRTAVHS